MRPLFGVLILICTLFFHEIEEVSGLLKRILSRKKSFNDDEDARAVSIYGTSRLTKPSAPTRNIISVGHQAFDLHEYRPDILESSHQLSSAEASDPVNRLKKNEASSSRGASSIRRIRNDQNGHQPAPQSKENGLHLPASHQRPIVADLNIPINIPEGQEKKISKTKSINLNRKSTYRSEEELAYYAFVRGPMIQGPYSPPGPKSIDLFNRYYMHRGHPPPESEEKALELYKSYEKGNFQDLNNPINIPEKRGRKKSQRKSINLNRKDSHESAELQASREFVNGPITQLGPHSPLRGFEDHEEITPERLQQNYDSLQTFHTHYGVPDNAYYRAFFTAPYGGSRSGSGN